MSCALNYTVQNNSPGSILSSRLHPLPRLTPSPKPPMLWTPPYNTHCLPPAVQTHCQLPVHKHRAVHEVKVWSSLYVGLVGLGAWEGLSRNNRLIERVIHSKTGHGGAMTNVGYHRVPGEKVWWLCQVTCGSRCQHPHPCLPWRPTASFPCLLEFFRSKGFVSHASCKVLVHLWLQHQSSFWLSLCLHACVCVHLAYIMHSGPKYQLHHIILNLYLLENIQSVGTGESHYEGWGRKSNSVTF